MAVKYIVLSSRLVHDDLCLLYSENKWKRVFKLLHNVTLQTESRSKWRRYRLSHGQNDEVTDWVTVKMTTLQTESRSKWRGYRLRHGQNDDVTDWVTVKMTMLQTESRSKWRRYRLSHGQNDEITDWVTVKMWRYRLSHGQNDEVTDWVTVKMTTFQTESRSKWRRQTMIPEAFGLWNRKLTYALNDSCGINRILYPYIQQMIYMKFLTRFEYFPHQSFKKRICFMHRHSNF
jgi:hypothetical protein